MNESMDLLNSSLIDMKSAETTLTMDGILAMMETLLMGMAAALHAQLKLGTSD